MKLSDFDYTLPKKLIAQEALPKRSDARLLVLDRKEGAISHRRFLECPDCFEKGDLLILNDTKVLPARLFGRKPSGGLVEVLLLEEKSKNVWEALVKPSRRARQNDTLEFGKNGFSVKAKLMDSPNHVNGIRRIEFLEDGNVGELMEKVGHIPLPPYIDRPDHPADRELYQTVFARKPGAVASPTAGLHFDQALLERLEAKGVEIAFITLHVSYGTFQPVNCEGISQHKIYSEYFDIPHETAEKVNLAKADGRRIIACGTTVVRTLETVARNSIPAELEARSGKTELFIYPPYEFKIVDAMITNFHLPRTTLLMLVAAFCGMENLKRAYEEAVHERYRFYSYGDAMMIL